MQGKIGGWAARPIATGMLHLARFAQAIRIGRTSRKASSREMAVEPDSFGGTESGLSAPKLRSFYNVLLSVGAPPKIGVADEVNEAGFESSLRSPLPGLFSGCD